MILYEEPMNIEFDNTKLKLLVDKQEISPNVRTFEEMRKVLKSPYVLANKNMAMYYMYRHIFDRANIRYDITYIPPKLIDDEYNKTHGHYHPKASDGYDYPEIYRVIKGIGLFILQKEDKNGRCDVYIVHAKDNDVIFIPPGFGHVSINPTEDTDLILENLVSDKFVSEYSKYEKEKGAAFYYTVDGLIQNTKYFIRDINQMKNPKKTVDLLSKMDIYPKLSEKNHGLLKLFHDSPNEFEFLNKPSILIESLKET